MNNGDHDVQVVFTWTDTQSPSVTKFFKDWIALIVKIRGVRASLYQRPKARHYTSEPVSFSRQMSIRNKRLNLNQRRAPVPTYQRYIKSN